MQKETDCFRAGLQQALVQKRNDQKSDKNHAGHTKPADFRAFSAFPGKEPSGWLVNSTRAIVLRLKMR